MATTSEEPSQAERLEAVAEAGMGADEKEHAAPVSDENGESGDAGASPAASSEVVAEEPKKEEEPEEPPRSTLKVFLIMLSLCVSFSNLSCFGVMRLTKLF